MVIHLQFVVEIIVRTQRYLHNNSNNKQWRAEVIGREWLWERERESETESNRKIGSEKGTRESEKKT